MSHEEQINDPELDKEYVAKGLRKILEINGELWGYDFAEMTPEQIYGAVTWFEFHNQQILNPPATSRELRLSGGVEYMKGAFGYLLVRVKKIAEGVYVFESFDPKKVLEAEEAFANAKGYFRDIENIRKSFFLNTDMPKIESYRRYKDLMGAIAQAFTGSSTPTSSDKRSDSATSKNAD